MRLTSIALGTLSSIVVAADISNVIDNRLQQALGSIWSGTEKTVAQAASKKDKKPNFVFIITDDQDLELGSVQYTPLIQAHLQIKGTFFKNHFVTTALCCPSRVSLWTGQQAHNTNVTDVNPPYGTCQ